MKLWRVDCCDYELGVVTGVVLAENKEEAEQKCLFDGYYIKAIAEEIDIIDGYRIKLEKIKR